MPRSPLHPGFLEDELVQRSAGRTNASLVRRTGQGTALVLQATHFAAPPQDAGLLPQVGLTGDEALADVAMAGHEVSDRVGEAQQLSEATKRTFQEYQALVGHTMDRLRELKDVSDIRSSLAGDGANAFTAVTMPEAGHIMDAARQLREVMDQEDDDAIGPTRAHPQSQRDSFQRGQHAFGGGLRSGGPPPFLDTGVHESEWDQASEVQKL